MLGIGIDHPFPWVAFSTITLNTKELTTINNNNIIAQSVFFDILENSAIAIKGSYSCVIDRTSFSNCRSINTNIDGSCINFDYTGKNGIMVSRTVITDCAAHQGTFIASNGDDENLGCHEMILVSIDRCPGSFQSKELFHTFFMQRGKMSISNINNTRCHVCRHFGPSFYYSGFAKVTFMNVADNSAQQCCGFSAGGIVDVRRCNFVRNTEGTSRTETDSIRGIVMSRFSNSKMEVYDSVIVENKYEKFLVFGCQGSLTLVGCTLQSEEKGTYENGAVIISKIVNRQSFKMTLYSSRDVHADLPLRSFCTRFGRRRTTLGLVVISLAFCLE